MTAPTLALGGIPDQTIAAGETFNFDVKPYWTESSTAVSLKFNSTADTHITVPTWRGAVGDLAEVTVTPTILGNTKVVASYNGSTTQFRLVVGSNNVFRINWRSTNRTEVEQPAALTAPSAMLANTTYTWGAKLTATGAELYLDGVLVREDTGQPPIWTEPEVFAIGIIGSSTIAFDGYIEDVKMGLNGANADKRNYPIDDGFAQPITDISGTDSAGTQVNVVSEDWVAR